MKFTLSWLKDHLDTAASLQEISETLTRIGLEVEGIADPAEKLKDFIVAEIVEASPHPNASKLQVCKVNDGTATRQIVCGAANARAGLKTVLAREGVFIPGSGITIKKTKIRDVESNGMLCSAEELGLDTKSEGILELSADAVPGSPAAAALGATDPVIEIAITPNRADALGVHGIARDLSAAGLGTLKPLPASTTAGAKASHVSVTLNTPACPLFIGCHITGVKNGPSPAWLQQRLKAIGLRPISALVDITNYMTFTYGRPLHVYDAKKLTGGITVHEAKAGETVEALDGKTYTLAPGMTVIADDAGVLGLGGIIGGAPSGVTEDTTEVFLEAALFDPVNIATTGRKLELLSDARYRFERGVDPAFVQKGAEIALTLIRDICGGEAGALVIAGKAPDTARTIAFSPERVKTLGGVDVPPQECERILTTLGFTVKTDTIWTLTPPSYRADVEGEADIVEEVLRIHGYQNIPVTMLPTPANLNFNPLAPAQQRVKSAKRVLASRGMMECCTWSFLPEAEAKRFGWADTALKLLNPISAELDTMRPSLIPNLLSAAKRNAARGFIDLALTETGLQFHSVAADGQRMVSAGIRSGAVAEAAYGTGSYRRETRALDAFDAKADALAVLSALGINIDALGVSSPAAAWYHPGRSGALTQGKNVLAYFGEVHPAITAQYDIESPVAAFEVFLDALPEQKKKGTARSNLKASDFQSVTRDFAFVVDAAVTTGELKRVIASADKALITQVQIFDVYSGKGVAEGKKSVAVQVTLQAPDRTLTEAEITAAASAVIAAAQKQFGAQLRA